MAYVFNRLANQMGTDEGKQNIFAMPGQQQQEGGPQAGGSSFKLTGGGQQAGAGAPTVDDTGESDAKNSFQLQSGAQQAQIGELNKPAEGSGASVTTDIGQTLAAKEDALKKEAETYTAETKKATEGSFYGDPGDVKSYVSGQVDAGDEAFGNLRSFISGEAAPQIEEFQSDVSTGDVNIPQTQADVATKLQQQSAVPTYSAGQARLDAALLGGTQDFQESQAALRDKRESIEGQRIRAEEAAAAEAEAARQAYTTQSGLVKDQLGELANELLAAQDPEEAALREQEITEDEIKRAYKEAGGTDYASGFLDGPAKLSDFYSRTDLPEEIDPRAFFDETERGRYNRLADLLELESAVKMDAPNIGGTFDLEGYNSAAAAEQAKLDDEAAEWAYDNAPTAGNIPPEEMGAYTPGSFQIDPNAPEYHGDVSGLTPDAEMALPGALQIPEYAGDVKSVQHRGGGLKNKSTGQVTGDALQELRRNVFNSVRDPGTGTPAAGPAVIDDISAESPEFVQTGGQPQAPQPQTMQEVIELIRRLGIDPRAGGY